MQLCSCAARTPHRSSSWPFLVRRSLQHLPSLASSRRTSALPSESAATSQSSHLGKTTAKTFPLLYRTGVQTRYSCATLMGAVVWLQLSGPSSIICRAQATKTTSSKPARCRFRSSTLAARPRQVGGNARQRKAWSALHRFASLCMQSAACLGRGGVTMSCLAEAPPLPISMPCSARWRKATR